MQPKRGGGGVHLYTIWRIFVLSSKPNVFQILCFGSEFKGVIGSGFRQAKILPKKGKNEEFKV
jgi:hypothetical protein